MKSLIEKNAELFEEVHRLRTLLREATGKEYPREWKLTPLEREVLSFMESRQNRVFTYDDFYTMVYANRTERELPEDSNGVLKVVICKLRRKLPAAYHIITHHREGYSLEVDSNSIHASAR
jgi:DNA-binding response OmpR family regulator